MQRTLLKTTPCRTTKPKKPRRVVYKDNNEEAAPKQQAKVDQADDPDYRPSASSSSSDEEDESYLHSIVSCPKYIIFSSCLKDLIFRCRCRICGSVLMTDLLEDNLGYMRGSMLTVKVSCLQGVCYSITV